MSRRCAGDVRGLMEHQSFLFVRAETHGGWTVRPLGEHHVSPESRSVVAWSQPPVTWGQAQRNRSPSNNSATAARGRGEAGDVHPASAGLRSTPGGTTSSIASSTSAPSVTSAAVRRSSSWSFGARSDEGGRHGRMLDRPRQRELGHREPGLGGDQPEALRRVELRVVVTVEVVGVRRRPRSGAARGDDRWYLPVSHPPDSGLHTRTPMPWRRHVGSTSRSMPRHMIEYGGCSECGAATPRRSAAQHVSTRSAAGNVDVPHMPIFPARTRSVSASTVSPMSVDGSGRWI